jgi:hypothetical protein
MAQAMGLDGRFVVTGLPALLTLAGYALLSVSSTVVSDVLLVRLRSIPLPACSWS